MWQAQQAGAGYCKQATLKLDFSSRVRLDRFCNRDAFDRLILVDSNNNEKDTRYLTMF
jgi:hypothetical protein